jgi:hypothetical protein
MTSLADLNLLSSGKVREIYEWDDDLLMVASDRISTYDVVMPTPIPDKGKVLNRMSVFWFGLTGDIVPNHFISEDVPEEVAERAMRVRRLEMYPVECVVRGYLSGSGWKEYKEGGAVCGIELPGGLVESGRPTATSPAALPPPSTSSSSATGPAPGAGTKSRRRRRSRPTWSSRRGPNTSRPTSALPASPSDSAASRQLLHTAQRNDRV